MKKDGGSKPAVPGPENKEGPSRPGVALFSVLAWPH